MAINLTIASMWNQDNDVFMAMISDMAMAMWISDMAMMETGRPGRHYNHTTVSGSSTITYPPQLAFPGFLQIVSCKRLLLR